MSHFLPLVLVFSIATVASAESKDDVDAGRKRPLVLQVSLEDEAITPGIARYLERAIGQAEEQNAECLIVVLDTPGGLLDSTETIVRDIVESGTCIVVYVAPSGGRAASAGVFITLASHVAAMAPGTRIGAAHPVTVGGLPFQPPPQEPPLPADGKDTSSQQKAPESQTPMEEKIVNDTVGLARALAELRHRNAEWAARAVKESEVLLSREAVEQGIVDFEAADLEELLQKLDGLEVSLPQGPHTLRTSGARVEEVPMWWGERVLAILSRPNIAFLLMIFGFYGVLFELYSPGWGVAGTLGIICLLLAMFGLAVLPVNFLGLALIVAAMGLFAAEVFVTSFGTLTIAGIVCLVLGGVMLVDSPIGFGRVSLGVILPVALATGLITVFLIGGIVRVHSRRVQTGDEALIGTQAEARSGFARQQDRYVGTVFVHGEWWQAISDTPIVLGQACTIEGRQGLALVVKASGTGESEA